MVASSPNLSEDEELLVEPTALFSSPSVCGRCQNDVKIGGMSITCAFGHSSAVFGDEQSFSIFQIADDTFHSVVTDVLGIQEGVRVKLAGERIVRVIIMLYYNGYVREK